jgi:transposase
VRHRDEIIAAIEHGLSNALVESMNTKIRLIIRMAFGFHSAEAIIALAMLTLGGHRPTFPNRKPPDTPTDRSGEPFWTLIVRSAGVSRPKTPVGQYPTLLCSYFSSIQTGRRGLRA